MLGLGDMVTDIGQAIATKEGYFNVAENPSIRNNNPGNLRTWGSQPIVDGYAYFDDVALGWQALDRQIQLNISRGLTLYEFFAGKQGVYAGYSPAKDGNDPVGYANFVAAQTGLNPSVPLNQLQSGGAVGIPITTDPNGGIIVDTAGDGTIFGMDSTTAMIAAAAGLLLIVGITR